MKAEIYQWVRILATFYILFTAVLQLMPDRKYERYIRSFMGLLLIYMLCTPLFSFLRESREMIGRSIYLRSCHSSFLLCEASDIYYHFLCNTT